MNKLVNNSTNEVKNEKVSDNSFFSKEGRINISPTLSRNQLLDYIRANQPITKYRLSKDLRIAYTTINTIIKTFEFAGLIKIRIELGSNNRTHALIYIPEGEVKLVEENKDD